MVGQLHIGSGEAGDAAPGEGLNEFGGALGKAKQPPDEAGDELGFPAGIAKGAELRYGGNVDDASEMCVVLQKRELVCGRASE